MFMKNIFKQVFEAVIDLWQFSFRNSKKWFWVQRASPVRTSVSLDPERRPAFLLYIFV